MYIGVVQLVIGSKIHVMWLEIIMCSGTPSVRSPIRIR